MIRLTIMLRKLTCPAFVLEKNSNFSKLGDGWRNVIYRDTVGNKQEFKNLRTILNHLTRGSIYNLLELYIFFTFTFGTLFALPFLLSRDR